MEEDEITWKSKFFFAFIRNETENNSEQARRKRAQPLRLATIILMKFDLFAARGVFDVHQNPLNASPIGIVSSLLHLSEKNINQYEVKPKRAEIISDESRTTT